MMRGDAPYGDRSVALAARHDHLHGADPRRPDAAGAAFGHGWLLNSPREALAAAKLADKLIKQRNAIWFDAVGADAPEPEAGDDRRSAARGGWRQAARLAALHGDDILSAWERRFCPTNSFAILADRLGKLELAGLAP